MLLKKLKAKNAAGSSDISVYEISYSSPNGTYANYEPFSPGNDRIYIINHCGTNYNYTKNVDHAQGIIDSFEFTHSAALNDNGGSNIDISIQALITISMSPRASQC